MSDLTPELRKIVGDANVITSDFAPYANDWRKKYFGKPLVVGNLVYSLVLGMSVPDVSGAAIANLEVETLQHKFPTFHGDTFHAETRVTSLFVTHDQDEAFELADRVVILHEGRVIYFGPVAELELSPHEHIKEFLAMDRV